ncbi:MAG: hypothetical protein ACI87C_002078 [Paraperlucidibaca sp.]|jgi:hypothetical protein
MIKLVILVGADDNTAAVCQDYWRLTLDDNFELLNSEICYKYSIGQAALSKILRKNCKVYDSTIKCEKCNGIIWFNSRTDWKSLKRKPHRGVTRRVCSSCDTAIEQKRRAALRELERAHYVEWRTEHIRLAKLIEAQYGRAAISPIKICALSFTDAVCLLAMFNLYGSDSLGRLGPLIEVMGKLTPTQELDELVVRHLQVRRLIGVHVDSSPEAFRESHNGRLVAIEPMVIWRPLFAENPTDIADFLDQLRDQLVSDEWPNHWKKEALSLCHKVALHECLYMLSALASERKLKVALGEKTRSNLMLILRSSSVGQCACIIGSCVKGASDYMVKEGVSSWQAANSISNNLIKRYQWLIDRDFEPYTWRRGAWNPESELSRVLFSVVMKAGHDWFAIPVSEIFSSREFGLIRA